MTLEQLRIFVAVAQMEHFTRAAERLGISQSAASGAISALEAECRVQLFDRSHRHVELTAAGNVMLAEAEEVLARVDVVFRRLEDLSELRTGRLFVAASQTVANYWLPARLQRFHEQYPGVRIDMWHGNSTEVEKRILRGEADLGFIEQEPQDQTLNAERIASDRLVAVVGPLHPWFNRNNIEWKELLETPWIMREAGSGTRALFEAALRGRGLKPEHLKVSLTLRTGEAVLAAVSASKCAAVVSELVASTALRAGALHSLDPIAVERAFVALSVPARSQSRTAMTFQEIMRNGVSHGDINSRLIADDDRADRAAE
jgi:DNA-binding transcriptional LysR family regulator